MNQARLANIGLAIIFLLALVGLALDCAAQPVDPYFSADIPVRTQDTKERQYAAQKGMQEVLVRLSGSEQVLRDDQIQQAVGQALRYVEQFQYRPVTDQDLLDRGLEEFINLTFSSSLLESLLSESKQPYWPVNRPSTLIWLVEDSLQEGKLLLNSSTPHDIIDSIKAAAKHRGLPIQFPLLDLQDQMNLSVDQVWQLDEQAIVDASARYSADVILVGRFSTTSRGQYLITWQFFHKGDTQVYDSRTDDVAVIGTEGVVPLVEYLSARYSHIPQYSDVPGMIMQLSGIETFRDYRKSLDYLEGLPMISDVAVDAVRHDTLLLRLSTTANAEKFINTLQLDNKIRPREQLPEERLLWQRRAPGSEENPLDYVWSVN